MANVQTNEIPRWYHMYRGRSGCVPASANEGVALAQGQLAPLKAAISLYTGKTGGYIEDLKSVLNKHACNEPVICEACGQQLTVYAEGHAADCYIDTLAGEVIVGATTIEARHIESELAYHQRQVDKLSARMIAIQRKTKK